MKTKNFLVAVFLFFPFWATAQWPVSLTAGAGLASETILQTAQYQSDNHKERYSNILVFGYAFHLGAETGHFFSPRTGMSAGVEFAYAKSPDDNISLYPDGNWRSISLKIPVSLLLALGYEKRSFLRFGFSTHISLSKKSPEYIVSDETYSYHSFFWSVHAGYAYQAGKRVRAGILLSRDITPYLEIRQDNVGIGANPVPVILFTDHYFFTLTATVSYRLGNLSHR
jgi:hypothetical protein